MSEASTHPHDDDDDIDGCCTFSPEDCEETLDEELPAAEGGVEP